MSLLAEASESIAPSTKLELLRFITPYGTSIEAIVDMSPHSQFIASSLNALGHLPFYGFIDTWVSNNTEHTVFYMNNVSKKCSAIKATSGNGWKMSVELVIWPHVQSSSSIDAVSVRPRATVVLAGGALTSGFPFGRINVQEAKLALGDVVLSEAVDFSHAAFDPAVYSCPNGASPLILSGFLSFLERKAQLLAIDPARLGYEVNSSDDVKEIIADLERDMSEYLAGPDFVSAVPIKQAEERSYLMQLQGNASLKPGMPIYFNDGAVFTDGLMEKHWWNLSTPFIPIGSVMNVINSSSFVAQINAGNFTCLSSLNLSAMPPLIVPKDENVMFLARSKVSAAIKRGFDAGKKASAILNEKGNSESDEELGAEVKFFDYSQAIPLAVEPLGRIDRGAFPVVRHSKVPSFLNLAKAKSDDAAESKVCVVSQQRQGKLFKQSFSSSIEAGERALLQLSITGHGWANTFHQCGEYCHAVYHIFINGKNAANVTQWRDDCRLNPIPKQRGTWWESRNGWCPGSVEPGVFIDVTPYLKTSDETPNLVELEVTVWSNYTHRYEPYTDIAGFAMNDAATLTVAMNVMLYGKDAVAAALSKSRSFSAAEAAIREGASDFEALNPPREPRWQEQSMPIPSLSQRSEKTKPKGLKVLEGEDFDFEARSPWYFYNSTTEGSPEASKAVVVVPVFQGDLVQINTRTINRNVTQEAFEAAGDPSTWQSVALHFRLEKPGESLDFDHWDRLGSIGLDLPATTSLDGVQVKTSIPSDARTLWTLKSPPRKSQR